MTHKKIITIIALVSVLITVSGCLESSRNKSAQLKWQRTMDQARLQAAQVSLQRGQLELAERLMENCQTAGKNTAMNKQAEKVQADILHENTQFARAGAKIRSIEEMIY